MNECMLAGRWGKDLRDLTSLGGAERASLVLHYGTPAEEESVECF